jgi:response regulator RpfG family c-di-GMP phosphodiesterase
MTFCKTKLRLQAMSNDEKISILIVDDEEPILLGLRALINNAFPKVKMLTTDNGNRAWQMINSYHPQIIISDLYIPGQTGLQLCKNLRDNDDFDDVVFIILTANTDKDRRLKALELGADDFLTKPFSKQEIIAKIKSAMRLVKMQNQLQEENQLLIELADELEKSFQDIIKLSVKFLQARIPASEDMLGRIANASVWIAEQFGEFEKEQIRDIDIAANLCYTGKIFLPDHLLNTPIMDQGRPTNSLMFQVPNSAREIVSSVPRFKDVGNILYHLFENYDGSGFPGRLKKWQIPLPSRIIRVPLDYEEYRQKTKKSKEDVIEYIAAGINRLYDKRVVALFEQYIKTEIAFETGMVDRAVNLNELKDGMMLSRDIITNSGMKIMAAGTILDDRYIKKIFAHNTTDPILGHIFVKA